MITMPATILNFFIIFSLKNLAFSRGLSVGGGGEGGDPSDTELCDPSDAEKYCEDSDPSDADKYGVGVDIDSS
jgi:hypothetical protein